MTTTNRASFQGHEYRESVLAEVRRGSTSCPSREEILEAAIAANHNPRLGNQNQYLDRGEIESGLKALIAVRRRREPEWYGSTVKAGTKLDPLLGSAMLYGRINQILDGELIPTTCEPKNRLRTQLLDARSDHRGLFSAIIPLEEGGDPNQAKTYFIERKTPGDKSFLYGPFPMADKGVGDGLSPVDDVNVYRTSPNRATFSFTSDVGANWQHDVEKLRIDEETRTITIPWKVYRPSHPSIGDGTLHYSGREFRLPPGSWNVKLTDAITGRVLARSRLE